MALCSAESREGEILARSPPTGNVLSYLERGKLTVRSAGEVGAHKDCRLFTCYRLRQQKTLPVGLLQLLSACTSNPCVSSWPQPAEAPSESQTH